MNARGGYRGPQAVKKSRGFAISNIKVYATCKQQLKELAKTLNIPIVEVIYRIINHKDFAKMTKDISKNIDSNWHKQDIEQVSDKE